MKGNQQYVAVKSQKFYDFYERREKWLDAVTVKLLQSGIWLLGVYLACPG